MTDYDSLFKHMVHDAPRAYATWLLGQDIKEIIPVDVTFPYHLTLPSHSVVGAAL